MTSTAPQIFKKQLVFTHPAYQSALAVIEKLRQNKFTAYLAGGAVRDALMGREPKDFDVATDAKPVEVQKVFEKTLAIGAAFGVIQVLHGGETIEVATFRRDENYHDGRRPEQVTFSSAAEDSLRRDFTINALFYDPLTTEIIDHVGGVGDLQEKIIRTVGDPLERFAEDHLRILRALRFECQLGFDLEMETRRAVENNIAWIHQVSRERFKDELHKILKSTFREKVFREENLEMLQVIFQTLDLETGRISENWNSPRANLEKVTLELEKMNDAGLARLKSWLEILPWAELVQFLKANKNDMPKIFQFMKSLKLSNSQLTTLDHLMKAQEKSLTSNAGEWLNFLFEPGAFEGLCIRDCDNSVIKEFLRWNFEKPRPLLSGTEAMQAHPELKGARLGEVLKKIYEAQLMSQIKTKAEALGCLNKLLA